MIAIIDYGMGNLYSVSQALEKMGFSWEITADPERLQAADGLILPGVGAFGNAMEELAKRNLIEWIRKEALTGKPLLGICLGMQLLFTSSNEHGFYQGLNLLPGRVVPFVTANPIPHMGWSWLRFRQIHPLFQNLEEDYVYFVHSFHVEADNESDVIADTDYDQPVTAVVARNHIFGMQFHPEKSGQLGRRLLARFAQFATEGKFQA
ncbi:glutamine amidotransferase [Seinonella peptonophila]|uniref:Imidazole glycerol phosphate synthase subunit HisH n=1 Tax=Seinonella peptonophila TaxID=112248 RepID=A0A1M4XNM7_9BACL|nr:imidazole glycerol phosphate synthase subunit HisH [Seinonella peptonophila]SHE94976.1 glutamine amidotransferase [Seinonella peptonophila]